MKVRNRTTDIFSLSFLDIVSCAFGAVILLLIISKPEISTEGGASKSIELLRQIFQADAENARTAKLNEQAKLELEGKKIKNKALADRIEDVRKRTRDESHKSSQLAQDRARIETILKEAENNAQIVETTPDPEPTEEVGGIPVDSDYVIFVIDTSGSMRDKWAQVKKVIDNVLTMHPQVRGFQIINDNGIYLKNRGRWISDTPTERRLALAQTNAWSAASNSNPYEGIAEALMTYGKAGTKLAIYVFGDDFSSLRFDDTAESISALNTSKISGRKRARIHGIGFTSGRSNYLVVQRGGHTFSLLMREVALENNGTYLSLAR